MKGSKDCTAKRKAYTYKIMNPKDQEDNVYQQNILVKR